MTTKKTELTIKNCHFVRPCEAEWSQLAPTAYRNDIRHCSACTKQVHLMTNEQDLAFAVFYGFCVAIPIELAKCLPKLEAKIEIARKSSRTHLLGAIAAPKIRKE
mgnify:CR=1 FL=1|jgi:hypothetical protein